jgi:hypothetical protein
MKTMISASVILLALVVGCEKTSVEPVDAGVITLDSTMVETDASAPVSSVEAAASVSTPASASASATPLPSVSVPAAKSSAH